MSNDPSGPLSGTPLRIESKLDLDEFLTEDGAQSIVRAASYEEVFFAIKHIGLADCLELLPVISARQIRGAIDLDCWRKDEFLPRPFIEWLAAFAQAGPEQAVRALTSMDEAVVSLFLKENLKVFEVDRDDPPEGPNLVFTPDSRFAVEPLTEGNEAAVALQVLDALFKYNPGLGSKLLSNVRYTTRMELEETAFDNKNRRLEAHGFVDYYEALSIYGGPQTASRSAADRTNLVEAIPGEESPGTLPAVFVDTLAGAAFLTAAFRGVTDPAAARRVAQELSALGNRILSANLETMGEVEKIRPALEEMRDTLSIGMELLTGGNAELSGNILASTYVQTVFQTGFDRLARLREKAHAVARIPRFVPGMLDSDDRDFLEALRTFKPLLAGPEKNAPPRYFRSVAEIAAAEGRLAATEGMIHAFMETFPSITDSFARTFNTAAVQRAEGNPFEATPLDAGAVQAFLDKGFNIPVIDIPAALAPFAERWIDAMRAELEPLRGQRIDPRFIATLIVKL